MVGRTKRPTKAEAERMATLSNMMCVACSREGKIQIQRTEIHHLLSGGRRRGHLFTIPLCGWHHRGEPAKYDAKIMAQIYGPSMARAPKTFRRSFGADDVLLAIVNKSLRFL